MNANLLSLNGLTETQTSRVRGWLAMAEDQVVGAYITEGHSEADARKIMRKIARCGLDVTRQWPTEVDRAAFALGRAQKAFDGEHKLVEAICLTADVQTSMASQVVQIGAPAIQMIRSFAKLQAALQLASDEVGEQG